MNNKTVNELLRERWLKAKADFLSEIGDIDSETVWQETEPRWWLEMMAAYRAVQ